MSYKHTLGALCLGFSLMSAAFATHTSETQHIKINYDNGSVYEMTISPKQLSWKGISGEGRGQSQTINEYQHEKLSNHIVLYAWTGNTGAYNTLVLDSAQHKVVDTGTLHDEPWFWKGRYKSITE